MPDGKIYAVGGYDGENDGDFYMSWADFSHNINRVYVCLLGTAPADAVTPGSWSVAEGTAGGKLAFGTFRTNPQYAIEGLDAITEPGTVKIALTLSQPDQRGLPSSDKGLSYTPVGLTVLEAGTAADSAHLNNLAITRKAVTELHKGEFWNKRDVSCELSLPVPRPAGSRVIVVPTT